MKCEVCQVEAKNVQSLARHVSLHNLTSKTYYLQYLAKPGEGECKVCGGATTYSNMSIGCSSYCSHKCLAVVKKETVKTHWERGDRRQKATQRMLGNVLSKGRPKGSKNLLPYPKTEAVLRRLELTKDYLNIRRHTKGWHHLEETKDKMSVIKSEQIKEGKLMRYQGKYNPQNPKKYSGNPSNIIYRSSYELKFMIWIDKNPDVIEWQSEEFCIPYMDPARDNAWRRYFPDFYVKVKKADGSIAESIIEIKPKSQTTEPQKPKKLTKRFIQEVKEYATNQAKWKAASDYCATKGWEFKILTEKELGIK